jgi:cbb3-type cytochrome oxidase subunit 1
MEASLPISAPLKPAKALSAAFTPRVGAASSVKLSLAFVLMGLSAFVIGVTWLAVSVPLLGTYHYNQFVIAATHLFVLGWISSVVMGAMYQLVPVALETKLFNTRLAWAQLVCHGIGFIGMVWMFKEWNMKQVGHFGSVMALSVVLFVYNITRTLLKTPKWTITASAIAAALAWLCLTVTMGLFVVAGKCFSEMLDIAPATGLPGALERVVKSMGGFIQRFDAISAMHAHAHLGGIGFFTMLIVGVSYKVIPMFTLSEIQSRHRAAFSVALLNLGLAGSFVTILLRSPWKLAFAVVVIVALALYAIELAAILGTRKRRSLDWGIKTFLTAVALLLPMSVLAVVLSWPGLPLTILTGRLENLYGFLGLVGVVSFAIIGMLYKIIPFLVWHGVYSKKVGLAKIPVLAELYSEPLQIAGYFTFLFGIAGISAGILMGNAFALRFGAIFLAASVGTLWLNVAEMISHFVRPEIQPLAACHSAQP